MNAVAFGMKRAFHGFLRVTRKPLASVGLTPARFDMLYVVFSHARGQGIRHSIAQRDLRRALGVCGSVVSRMLRQLEEHRLVIRRRCDVDGRQVRVWLTWLGWQRIKATQRWLLRAVQRLVLEAICFGKHRDAEKRFWNMAAVESYLHVLRCDFGDHATHYYAWGHPDD
ncbi:MAG: MarR family transcriptional regulator [Polyangiaceae bacterium]|jgi:DNA-binding MarR family transcriptional regulator